MIKFRTQRAAFAVAVLFAGVAGAAAPTVPGARATPYWASLAAGQARMRTGPGRNYPASWLYQHAGLPLQVIEVYPGWRKVRDPDGAEGWMIANLLSAQRTAIVRAGPAELRASPAAGASIAWHVKPGAIGSVSQCGAGWCRFDVSGRGGFVETDHLWGVDPQEKIG